MKIIYSLLFVIFILFGCLSNRKDKKFEELEELYEKAKSIRFESPLEARDLLFTCDSLNKNSNNYKELNFKINIALGLIYGAVFNNLDSAKYYYHVAYKYQNSKEELGYYYAGLANINGVENKLDSAIINYQLALKYFTETGMEDNIVAMSFNMASVMRKLGQKDSIIFYYQKFLEYKDKTTNINWVMYSYIKVGETLLATGNSREALKYYRQAFEYAKSNNIYEGISTLYIRMGEAYAKEGKRDSAMLLFDKVLSNDLINVNQVSKAAIYTNIGNIYLNEEKNDSAKYYFEKSLAIGKELGMEEMILVNSASLTTILLEEKEYKRVIKTLATMLSRVDSIDNKTIPMLTYFNLSMAYEGIEDYKQALSYYKQAANLQNSLKDTTLHQQIIDTEKKYQTKLKDQQITYLTQLSEKRKEISYGIAGILTLTMLLSVFIILWFRGKRNLLEKKHKLEVKDNEIIKLNMAARNRELTSTLLHLSCIQDIGRRIKAELEQVLEENITMKISDFNTVFQYIDNLNDDNHWSEFYARFNELNDDFLKRLTSMYPNLTASEIRLCALLRLNITSKDISFLTNRSLRSVENMRYRIRKKMNMKRDESLAQFILSF